MKSIQKTAEIQNGSVIFRIESMECNQKLASFISCSENCFKICARCWICWAWHHACKKGTRERLLNPLAITFPDHTLHERLKRVCHSTKQIVLTSSSHHLLLLQTLSLNYIKHLHVKLYKKYLKILTKPFLLSITKEHCKLSILKF